MNNNIDISPSDSSTPKKDHPFFIKLIYRLGAYIVLAALPIGFFSYMNSYLAPALPSVNAKKVKDLYGLTPPGSQNLIPEVVDIPAGTFEMGSNYGEKDESPVHKVALNAFRLGRFEVTNAQWKAFCDAKKREYPPNPEIDPNYFLANPNHPVINVSWEEATEYCSWLSEVTSSKYRLPTEAEWEYAAQNASIGEVSGARRGRVVGPNKVGAYKPNPYGIYDTLGNVWEWCNDWYDSKYYQQNVEINPTGPQAGALKVVRGGSWGDPAALARVSNRIFLGSKVRYQFYGLRVAQDK